MQQVHKAFPSEDSKPPLPLAATRFPSRGCQHPLLSFWCFSNLHSPSC